MTQSDTPAASGDFEARLDGIRSMLGRVVGPTASVRIYEHEAKLILAALSRPAPGEGEVVVPERLLSDLTAFLNLWGTTRAEELIDQIDAARQGGPDV